MRFRSKRLYARFNQGTAGDSGTTYSSSQLKRDLARVVSTCLIHSAWGGCVQPEFPLLDKDIRTSNSSLVVKPLGDCERSG